MPAAKSYRVKVPSRTGGKSLAKARTESGLKRAYNIVRSEFPKDVIRIVAPSGARRNLKPGSALERRLREG